MGSAARSGARTSPTVGISSRSSTIPSVYCFFLTGQRPILISCFCSDVDETKDWIQEKDEALNSEDYGRDLRSVQALQRKHEGLERDLAALGDKVRNRHGLWYFKPLIMCSLDSKLG